MTVIKLFAVAVISYLLGSLNFGVLLSRKIQKEDVRTKGSGNAGTTNMLRNYGKKVAFLTIAGDMLKVVAAILLARVVIEPHELADIGLATSSDSVIILKSFAGFFAVLGHIFPCYFNFKGGKGVATSGGMVFMIDWRIALILLLMFAVTVFITKYVSLGSLVMAFFYPIFIFIFYKSVLLTVIAAMFAVIVFIAHRKNIVSLINGTEHKINEKKNDKN